MKRTCFYIFVFLCLFYSELYSQNYPFKNYTVDDGLLADITIAVAVDEEGTLAFGSAKGVTVFTP